MLQKKTKRVLSLATALALVCTGISFPDSNVAKAKENIIKSRKEKENCNFRKSKESKVHV
ncbi:MAG: hypothetical protein SO389_01845 [Eubacterium sp.]|nr:hypothetical protein [Eubacterium sp.]